jgi:mono/diheme cytochrome c family protein
MTTMRIALALLVLALGVGMTACGGDDDSDATPTTEETTTEGETTLAGSEIFVANCGSCHTLSDAGTTGTVGPGLDGLGFDAATVEAQVRAGGGGMPAFEGELSDEEIEVVSAYVADASS